MEAAFDKVKRQLFDQLHDVVRQRIFYVRACRVRGRALNVAVLWMLTRARTPDRLAGAAGGRGRRQQRKQPWARCSGGDGCGARAIAS